ncbi:MAG TPA: ABC transporter ATP-binding protein [Solirubrobacteraceae bacterium]|jgi:iron(III) transport system ATP-binding protein|nr:ABC transporter ATP-binding protein [Solirubrobacteraceae bacterium]
MSGSPNPDETLSGPGGGENQSSKPTRDAELPSGLDVVDLHKSFGTHPVLSGLDLIVPTGSFTAILGSSGSGKTTLLRLLAGFDRPDRGVVKIGGRVMDGAAIHIQPERRRIGYVPQEGGLFPHLTVAANVGFGLSRATRRGRVNELLALVGLADLGRRYPHQLSGGQQQRVALARALAIEPDVVLLDEPFASLDAHMRASVREEVQRILQASATTTLLVTHDQDEALSLADRVAVLRDGRIAQHATPQELYARPLDDRLARFVGEANLIAGVLDGASVQTPLGKLPALWHGEMLPTPCPVSVLIRPEQIDLHPADSEAGFAGRIVRTGYHGHDAVLHVQVDQPQTAEHLLVRTLGETRLSTGLAVKLDVRGPVLVWPASTSH